MWTVDIISTLLALIGESTMRLPYAEAILAARATINSSSGTGSVQATTIQIPTTKPAWAEHLSPQLAGFSIEQDRWPDWAGYAVGQPNNFTNQLLKNLGERTGVMPFLRVGANSEDRTTIDTNTTTLTIRSTFPDPTPDVPNPEADHNYIGPDFYALASNFPAGTTFQWGINLLDLNITETAAQAALLADTFQGSRKDLLAHVHLANVEIGNEPDFYGNGYSRRPGPLGDAWTPSNYSVTWAEYARAVAENIELGGEDAKGPYLSPGALAGFVAPVWAAPAIYEGGLLDDDQVRANTNQWTDHSYFGAFTAGANYPPGSLMSKTSTRGNFTGKTHNIQATRAQGLKYVFGETNSYANHGIPGLSNTLESAIWVTDWMLLSASRRVERCHFHHGVGFRYNAFQPVANSDDGTNITRPHILPSYNGYLAVNEAIGTTGESWIAEIYTENNNVTAYGVYENKQLVRMVVLNQAPWDGQGEKPSYGITFKGWQDGWKGTVKRLLGAKTTSLTGITWGGQSFETESGVPEGAVVTDEMTDGYLEIEATSVALITLQK